MPLTLSLTLVVTFSFLVSRILHRFSARWLTTSSAYVGVGVLCGPEVGGVLDRAAIEQLGPAISVTLGVVGFVLGLPLARELRSAGDVEAGLGAGSLTIVGVGAASFLALRAAGIDDPVFPALTLGAAAAATSRPTLDIASRRLGARGEVTKLVKSMALVGDILAVMVSGFALAVAVAGSSSERLGLGPAAWILASAAIGVACGLLFHFFMAAEASEERVFLATVGVIVFASGLASAVGISALVLNAVAGVTVAVASRRRGDRAATARTLAEPAVIVLLIFAGALWSSEDAPVAPLLALPLAAVGFAVLRAVALFVFGRLAVQLTPRVEAVPRVGYGLFPLGGVSVAIALNYRLLDLPAGNLVLTAVAGAAIVTELFASSYLTVLLVDAGEVPDLDRTRRSG